MKINSVSPIDKVQSWPLIAASNWPMLECMTVVGYSGKMCAIMQIVVNISFTGEGGNRFYVMDDAACSL